VSENLLEVHSKFADGKAGFDDMYIVKVLTGYNKKGFLPGFYKILGAPLQVRMGNRVD